MAFAQLSSIFIYDFFLYARRRLKFEVFFFWHTNIKMTDGNFLADVFDYFLITFLSRKRLERFLFVQWD